MTYITLLNEIFQACIIPLIWILSARLISFLQAKTKDLISSQQNAKLAKYEEKLAETISICVTATTQTYVSSLKNKNAFDKQAQIEAFNMTYDAIMAVLTDEAKSYLEEAYGDLNEYITARIEAEVLKSK